MQDFFSQIYNKDLSQPQFGHLLFYVSNNSQLMYILPVINTINRPIILLCEPEVYEEVEVETNVIAIDLYAEESSSIEMGINNIVNHSCIEGIIVLDNYGSHYAMLYCIAKNKEIPFFNLIKSFPNLNKSSKTADIIKSINKIAVFSYLKNNQAPKLHLGCGPYVMKEWLNTDIQCKSPGICYLDAGKNYPYPDESFEYIYSEHLFEHLSIKEQIVMLQECFRILKKNGYIRIAMPNFHFLMDLYMHPEKEINRKYLEWSYNLFSTESQNIGTKEHNYPIYVINNFFHLWGHKFIHTPDSFIQMAKNIGFDKIHICPIGKSNIPYFIDIEKHHQSIPKWANDLETFVIEMTK